MYSNNDRNLHYRLDLLRLLFTLLLASCVSCSTALGPLNTHDAKVKGALHNANEATSALSLVRQIANLEDSIKRLELESRALRDYLTQAIEQPVSPNPKIVLERLNENRQLVDGMIVSARQISETNSKETEAKLRELEQLQKDTQDHIYKMRQWYESVMKNPTDIKKEKSKSSK